MLLRTSLRARQSLLAAAPVAHLHSSNAWQFRPTARSEFHATKANQSVLVASIALGGASLIVVSKIMEHLEKKGAQTKEEGGAAAAGGGSAKAEPEAEMPKMEMPKVDTEAAQKQFQELLEAMKKFQLPAGAAEAMSNLKMPSMAGFSIKGALQGSSADPNPSGGFMSPMTRAEAFMVLGCGSGSSNKEVQKQHRNLMRKLHPDLGGSPFVAGKINEAKDLIMSGKG